MNHLSRLNYHHLYYFFRVAKLNSFTRAARELKLSQPTISSQLRLFEKTLGHQLLFRKGKATELTEVGKHVLGYAEHIFRSGKELIDTVDGGMIFQKPLRIGILDVVPKFLAHRVILGALNSPDSPKIICVEGSRERLLSELAAHELDLVLTDSMVTAPFPIKVYHHSLGESGLSFMATSAFARKLRKNFPNSLSGAPVLLPTELSAIRPLLDEWFRRRHIEPKIVGEFQDSALMEIFGKDGLGVFIIPMAVEKEVMKDFHVSLVGRVPELKERFFLISAERKLTHPGVLQIIELAHQVLIWRER